MSKDDELTRFSSDRSFQLTLIGMPCWEVTQPFHALAQVAGIAVKAGWNVRVEDVNIDFYRYVTNEDKKFWSQDYTHLWLDEKLTERLWQTYAEWFQETLKNISEHPATDLTAFSVNFCNRNLSIRAAKLIKERCPNVPVMFGGVDCFPAEQNKFFLAEGPSGARYCDIICQGEAEISFAKYLGQFAATNDWRTSVRGFAYYKDNVLVDTGPVEIPPLREELPMPAYDLFDLKKYTVPGSFPFFLSRGCCYNCYFCSEKPNFKPYRSRKADSAFNELLTVLALAKSFAEIPSVSLGDSNLNVNMLELNKLLDLIEDHDVHFKWGGQAHFDKRLTFDVLSKMKNCGFESVFWGFESGSQNVINLMNKRYSHTIAHRIIQDCIKLGIKQHIPILIGYPGESPSDVVDTLAFILSFKDKPFCNILTPSQVVVRPNSPLFERYADFGLANNNCYDWHSTDQKNSLAIRIVRRFMARNSLNNNPLDIENVVDNEEIKSVNLNDLNLAYDIFYIVEEIWGRCGKASEFKTEIYSLSNITVSLTKSTISRRLYGVLRKLASQFLNSSDHTTVEGTCMKNCIDPWLSIDKNSHDGRAAVYKFILKSLQILQQTINRLA